jgi:predicted  nucleic acid-binding Zn-ribbon protein
MSVRWFIAIGLCALLTQSLYAQPATALPETPAENEQPQPPADPPTLDAQLRTLLETIQTVEAERTAINRQLRRTTNADEAQKLQEHAEQLARRLENLRISFEELATKGLSTDDLKPKPATEFDWQQELEEVIRPLLDELKQLTERPRTIERLRGEQTRAENQIQIAETAMGRLETTLQQIETSAVTQALEKVLEEWRDHYEEAESRLQRINSQIEWLTTPSEETTKERLVATFQKFTSGRGLNLALAVGGFILTYLALAGLGRLVGWLNRKRQPTARRLARVSALFFRGLTLVLALSVASMVLYARGDWFLLGLLILVLIGVLLGLRQSLPRHVQEIRTLLDMGSVREGERIIYNGIPWRIATLNIYSTLRNPLLRGGVLRLPLERLVDLQSRPHAPDEPWFPSRENDIVILDGDIWGKVLLQTPEIVQVRVIGSIKTFAAAEYLHKNPRNLSQDGFAIPVVFGLDYRHQAEILTDIVPRLRVYLEEHLRQQPFHPHLTTLLVEFNEAAGSALDLLIVAGSTIRLPATRHGRRLQPIRLDDQPGAS